LLDEQHHLNPAERRVFVAMTIAAWRWPGVRQARKPQQYELRKPEIEQAHATIVSVVVWKADRRQSATTSPSAWSKLRQALKKLEASRVSQTAQLSEQQV
jgi:hypothetical protein